MLASTRYQRAQLATRAPRSRDLREKTSHDSAAGFELRDHRRTRPPLATPGVASNHAAWKPPTHPQRNGGPSGRSRNRTCVARLIRTEGRKRPKRIVPIPLRQSRAGHRSERHNEHRRIAVMSQRRHLPANGSGSRRLSRWASQWALMMGSHGGPRLMPLCFPETLNPLNRTNERARSVKKTAALRLFLSG